MLLHISRFKFSKEHLMLIRHPSTLFICFCSSSFVLDSGTHFYAGEIGSFTELYFSLLGRFYQHYKTTVTEKIKTTKHCCYQQPSKSMSTWPSQGFVWVWKGNIKVSLTKLKRSFLITCGFWKCPVYQLF